jgi:hypothetical protein
MLACKSEHTAETESAEAADIEATPTIIRAGTVRLWNHPDSDFEMPRSSKLARLATSVWAAMYAAHFESEPSILLLEELGAELGR